MGPLDVVVVEEAIDGETGLHQNWFRDYAADHGRYYEADPLGNEDSYSHLYGYAANNPLHKFDADGLKGETCCEMTSDLPTQSVATGLECMSKCLDCTIYISSGWRTVDHNKAEGGASKSYHVTGLAADVHTPPALQKLRQAAAHCGFYVLSTRYPSWIHVDLRGNRTPKRDPDDCECRKIRGD